MAILSTNQRLINVGDSYSAGNGIDITNNIISVTGDNAPYSAGDNIDIQDHIISGKDWSNDIEQASANAYNVTTAWVQDNYANSADMTYISAMVDTKLDTSAWSSVSGDLATESYVIMADNITYERAKGYVDSKGFATEEFVNENTSGKLDSTAFDTWQQGQYTNDIASLNNLIGTKLDASSFEETSGTFYPTSNPSGFITGVDLSNYYTKDETSGKEELANAFANIPVGDPEVNAYVHNNSASIDESTNVVQSNSSNWNDVTAYQSNSANYITAHQDISNLMPKSESANFYPMTGNPSGFINTLPEEEEVEFEEINLSSFATSSQINDLSAAIDYVSANAGDEFPASADEVIQCVQSNSSNWQSVSNKLDSDVFTAWSANQASNNYQLSAGDGISIIDDDINKITRIDCTVTGGSGGDAEVNTLVHTNSGTWNTVTDKLDTSSFSDVSGTFLTAHQSLADYIPYSASGVELPNSHFKVDTDGRAYKLAVVNSAEQPLNDSFFQQHNTLYYPFGKGKRYIVNVPSNRTNFIVRGSSPEVICSGVVQNGVCDFVYPSSGATGYKLFETYDDDIPDSLTTANCKLYYFTTASPSSQYVLSSELPTYQYDNTNKISAINGSALAGGGGNPEVENYVQTNSAQIDETVTSFQTNSSTYMVEPNLEYNAVNEISGYNGSAIAQYCAEKQWLVHDDTLCHLSNSAQYALGVAIDNVARLMGLDETVILDRGTDDLTAPNTAQLSEPFSAFEKIEMWCVWNPWPTNVPQATYYPGNATQGSYMVFDNSQYMRAGYGLWRTSGTTIQLISASQTINWPTFTAGSNLGGIRKIIGIGRKS